MPLDDLFLLPLLHVIYILKFIDVHGVKLEVNHIEFLIDDVFSFLERSKFESLHQFFLDLFEGKLWGLSLRLRMEFLQVLIRLLVRGILSSTGSLTSTATPTTSVATSVMSSSWHPCNRWYLALPRIPCH